MHVCKNVDFMSVINQEQQNLLSACIHKAIPFVAYRMPFGEKARLLVANQVQQFMFQGQDVFSQEGFVVVPFDNDTQSSFILTPKFEAPIDELPQEHVAWIHSLPDQELSLPTPTSPGDKEQYIKEFQAISSAIKQGQVDKAILSRCNLIDNIQPIDAPQYFARLCGMQHTSYNYLLFIPHHGLWLGASPELFLRRGPRFIETVSLAGTIKQEDPSGWKDKELQEQGIVTDYISEKLSQFHIKEVEKNGPVTINAGKVSHLKTLFRFPKQSLQNHIGRFVEALHPTPAVCGYPKAASKALVLKTEHHPRALYAGFLGRIHPDGCFDFFVNIRCAQFFSTNQAGLYVGGGITQKSEAQAEYNETQLKAETLLKVFVTQQR